MVRYRVVNHENVFKQVSTLAPAESCACFTRTTNIMPNLDWYYRILVGRVTIDRQLYQKNDRP